MIGPSLFLSEEKPEFVLLNKEPEPDPENPSRLVYTEDPVILHTPTGRIINYVDDDEHGIRLFWQPPVEEGEEIDPDKAEFLPLGFDEFYGREVDEARDNFWVRLVTAVENKCKPVLSGLEKWTEEKKKASEAKMELLKKEMELVDAELDLKEAIEDLDEELEILQKEEEKKMEQGVVEEEDVSVSETANELEQTPPEAEDEEDEEDDEEEADNITPSSFGSIEGQNSANNDQKGSKSGKSTFAALSLSIGTSNLFSLVSFEASDILSHAVITWRFSLILVSFMDLTGPTKVAELIFQMEGRQISEAVNYSRSDKRVPSVGTAESQCI